jgi:GDP-D-mannose dehydratase
MIRWRSPLDNIKSLIPEINSAGRVQLLYGDLRDTISVEKVVETSRPDYVFHLAAQSYPLTSFDAPLDTLETNIQGTVRVLEALKKHRPQAVTHVCASSEVFGRVSKDKIFAMKQYQRNSYFLEGMRFLYILNTCQKNKELNYKKLRTLMYYPMIQKQLLK